MEAIEHLAGCNGRHDPRQQCNGQRAMAPPEDPLNEAPVEPCESDPPSLLAAQPPAMLRSDRARVFLAGAFAVASAVALAIVVFGIPDRPTFLGGSAGIPELPSYAIPVGSETTENRTVERAVDPPIKYRLVTFVSHETAADTYYALRDDLEDAGWYTYAATLDESRGSFSFLADSENEAMCARYAARSPVEAPADPGLLLIIKVEVIRC